MLREFIGCLWQLNSVSFVTKWYWNEVACLMDVEEVVRVRESSVFLLPPVSDVNLSHVPSEPKNTGSWCHTACVPERYLLSSVSWIFFVSYLFSSVGTGNKQQICLQLNTRIILPLSALFFLAFYPFLKLLINKIFGSVTSESFKK